MLELGPLVIVARLERCPVVELEGWETRGKIEALKERFTRERPCPGWAWFAVLEAPRPVEYLCGPHAAERLRARSSGARVLLSPVDVRCACGHAGTRTERGGIYCNRCNAAQHVPELRA